MHCHTVTGSRGRPVCLQPQFIRMSSNSFVYLPPPKIWTPIHSYVCQFIRISSLSKKNEPQFIRVSSNSFVYLPLHKNLIPNSFVYFPIHSYIFHLKKNQCAQQSVLLLSHSQSSGCHTVAVGLVTQWVLGFCPSFVTEWAIKLPGNRPLACHTVSP